MGLLKNLRRAFIDRPFWIDHEAYLREVRGVVHVGANSGQERKLYARYDLPVVWVEPIPEVFAELERNIAAYPKQRAYRALITERPGEQHELHVASNGGASSSILDLKRHTEIWPQVHFQRSIKLESESLPSFFERHALASADYDFLSLDTQGSEMMVLRGAAPMLRSFKYLNVEVADFESYAGCAQLDEMGPYLASLGFAEHVRLVIARKPGIGTYYDIVYRRAG